MKKLPELVPVLPTKDIRLTLSPVEAVSLYLALDKMIDSIPEDEKLPDPIKVMASCLEFIHGSLQDRLSFEDAKA